MEMALRRRLLGLLRDFAELRVMVVGDLALDHYLIGDAGRISREYPVVILTHHRDEYRLGGAANTVANFASLGAGVVAAGWIGADANGDKLVALLSSTGCETHAVAPGSAPSPARQTRPPPRGPP